MMRPMLRPFRSITGSLRWLRGYLDQRIVATGHYGASTAADPAGARHIVSFMVDGNGHRFSSVNTTSKQHAATHEGMMVDRVLWRVHGDLPNAARRVDHVQHRNLIVFPGGKSPPTAT